MRDSVSALCVSEAREPIADGAIETVVEQVLATPLLDIHTHLFAPGRRLDSSLRMDNAA